LKNITVSDAVVIKSNNYVMGKGDIKTKKGKISNQSFGKLRKHKTDKPVEKKEEDSSPKK
jgi:30S ribosomal protein S31